MKKENSNHLQLEESLEIIYYEKGSNITILGIQ